MKINKLKIILGFSVSLLFMVSCSKEESSIAKFDENTIAKRLQFIDVNTRISNEKTVKSLGVTGIIVEWDEWGRASLNCGGWGLCNANWFPSSGKKAFAKRMNKKGGATLLEFDSNSKKYYIDILLAATVPIDIPKAALALKIDKDFEMNVQQAVGQNLTFHKGNYSVNYSLGEFGGYRIYLD